MPILYVCCLNKNLAFITEALGTKTQGDFKLQVLKAYDNFEEYSMKMRKMDDDLAMAYRDQKDYALACIFTSYDIKEAEAYKFLQKIEEFVTDTMLKADMDSKRNKSRGSSVINNYSESFD